MIERRPIVSREEWLAWRRQDITAGVIPALYNEFPDTYETTHLSLYHEKRNGIVLPNEDSKVKRAGRYMEAAIGAAVEELRPDWQIERAKTYFRDPNLRLGATPDFFVWTEATRIALGILEAKSVTRKIFIEQWNDGRDPPLWVRLQIAVQMMLSNAAFGIIVCMPRDPHDMDPEIVQVERNSAVEARIVETVKQFWADVEAGNKPQPDFTRDAELIKALSPIATPGRIYNARDHNQLGDMLARRADLRAAIKVAETECTTIEAEIKHTMADAEIVSGLDGWHITYRNQTRKGYSVPPGNPRVLLIKDQRPEERK